MFINSITRFDLISAGNQADESAVISFIAWIVLGLIAGCIAIRIRNNISNNNGEGLILDIVLGVGGAIIGGYLTSLIGINQEILRLNIPSLIVSVVGAVLFLVVYHAIRTYSLSSTT